MSSTKSQNLQLITCGTSLATSPVTSSFPAVEQIAFADCQQLKNYVINNSNTYSFILFFSDCNHQPPRSDLEDLKKKNSIFACFFCVKLKANFTLGGGNVFPVTKQFLTQKLTSCIIQFYEQTSGELLKSGHIFFADRLKRIANDIKRQRRLSSTTIHAPHVLIIPMNVTEEHAFEFQERLIDVCNDLCSENEPTVCTLDDYVRWNENLNSYADRDLATLCSFIKKIARIRLYYIGNERQNIHSFSRTLLESESNYFQTNEYDEKYTFVEYQSVTEQTRRNLSNIIGSRWESEDIQLKRLDDLRNDIQFAAALERVNANKEARAMAAHIELNQQAIDPADNSVEISTTYQFVGQPVSVPAIPYTGAAVEINDMIHENFS